METKKDIANGQSVGDKKQYPHISKNENQAKSKSNLIESPSISLPKGGGAIKSIDEKFQVNAANGTASFSIPFPVSQVRGFSPSLGLGYNSGGGNSPFGLGWNQEAPSISRKTDKKYPEYKDEEESDVFMYSGSEDLVPYLGKDGKQISGRYRPRVEGGFARIEKINEQGNVYWKVISKENIVSIFGKSPTARIADPNDKTRIFQWFLEFTYDDKGNCTQYEYQIDEDFKNVPDSVYEQNRKNSNQRITNTYLKRILYGNKTPWYTTDNQPLPSVEDYLISIVFDYGEFEKTEHNHESNDPLCKWISLNNTDKAWACRKDAFSECRAGFEIRTYRLCQRILQFHHFPEPDKLNKKDYLVRSMEFTYDGLPVDKTINDLYVNNRPFLTYLTAITQYGFIWNEEKQQYSQKALPPLTFEYAPVPFYENKDYFPQVQSLSRDSLKHLPIGIDDKAYTWIDLYSEGISGILTEQGESWYYKENLGNGNFTPAKEVLPKPNYSGLSNGVVQLQDLEANGLKQLVTNQIGTQGYFELSEEEEWQPFMAFRQFPNIDLSNPNVKFLDLNGDGMADLLLTEDEVFRWYPSKGKIGYDDYQCQWKAKDEEKGPAIVFADSTQSIVLADMSGDGMVDIVRIRNGEVCYWQNLGFGRFGAKVTMEKSPYFDAPELFNPHYIRLVDIDGSGTTDIIYLAHNEFKIWFNQSGNLWSMPSLVLNAFPHFDSDTDISIIDFLGNGTSCIVWSSPSPQFAQSPLRYIDLMGGKKPHIMKRYINNLGKEIIIEYKSSTEYYLVDKIAGTPWVTKLPFPVQCVSKTIVEDKISQTRFTTQYKYRHGYYDYIEREFRGFGFVEQTDIESYEDYSKSTPFGGLMTTEKEFFQPAVISKTWFHLGAFFNQEKIVHQFKAEYWKNPAYDDKYELSEPKLDSNWTTKEWLEALRSLKGMPLRQEIYSDEGAEKVKKNPYSVATYNYNIRQIQAKQAQKHAVFLPHELETLTLHYERNPQDPRIAHTINVFIDEYGNVREAVSIVYGRLVSDMTLPKQADRDAQAKTQIIYTQNNITNKIDDAQTYRLPIGFEAITWELQAEKPKTSLYTLEEIQTSFQTATIKDYVETLATKEKRKIEHTRTKFLKDDLTALLPFETIESKALVGEAYGLTMTTAMVNPLFGTKVSDSLLRNEGKYIFIDSGYWIASGRTYLQADVNVPDLAFAKSHFYIPFAFQDNFGSIMKVEYGDYQLFIQRTIDALQNETVVEKFNYRTLAPYLMRDANDNRSGVRLDELGLPICTFAMGKASESLGDFMDISSSELSPNDQPTTQLDYEFRYFTQNGKPNRLKTQVREKHHFKEVEPESVGFFARIMGRTNNTTPQIEANPIWQVAYSYSDGSGHEVLKKIQVEKGEMPERDNEGKLTGYQDITTTKPRWVGTGRTILNNKGNPVKQYEPFFDSTEEYNDEKELLELGFTPLLYYDALGRMIKTINPNGTFSKVVFDSWKQITYDENDTVKDSKWYQDRISRGKGIAEQTTAQKAELHYDTPTVVHLDSMARLYLSITHNVSQRTTETSPKTEFYETRSEYDIEGNVKQVIDARNNVVMAWQYDMLGNVCQQISMDAGSRWQINDAMGRPLRSWDARNQIFSFGYDLLHRPTEMKVNKGLGEEIYEKMEYGENAPNAKANNLRGKPYRHYDTAGLIENVNFDFKGNLINSNRTLLKDYKTNPNWNIPNPISLLESEVFSTETHYDALNRPVWLKTHDQSISLPEYNEANLLNAVKVAIKGKPATTFVSNIDYNAKGQREKIVYGNQTATRYTYEPDTYRLKRLQTYSTSSSPSGGGSAGATPPSGGGGLQDLNYTYDPVGNITEIYDNAQKTAFYGGQKVDARQEYGYDALYRLTEATGREHIGQMDAGKEWNDDWAMEALQANNNIQLRDYRQQYSYDGVGNILKMQHFAGLGSWTRLYNYRADNNQLISTVIGGKTAAYGYNEHGSMLNMPHLAQIDWNFKEEIIGVDLGGGGKAYYNYDSAGQRSRKVIERQGGLIEERLYLGMVEIYREKQGTSLKLERETLHIMDDKQRIAMVDTKTIDISSPFGGGREGGLIRYQYANHLGSASLEADENGRIISYEEYHPYGTTAYQAKNKDIKATAKRYRYTGMERDEETGLNYHSARYYLPWLGRWGSCDPIGIGDGVNVYRYVGDNPVLKVDLLGNEEIIVVGAQNHDVSDPKKYESNKLMFVNEGLRELKLSKDKSKTFLIFKEQYTSNQLAETKKAVEAMGGKYVEIDSIDDLVKYINTKSLDGQNLRSTDLIKKISIFSHGLPSKIAFGFELTNPNKEKSYELDESKLNNISKSAFDKNSTFEIYACRTGTDRDLENLAQGQSPQSDPSKSLAQKLADKSGIEVKAPMNRTDYRFSLGTEQQRDRGETGSEKKVDNAVLKPSGADSPVVSSTTPENEVQGIQTFRPKSTPIVTNSPSALPQENNRPWYKRFIDKFLSNLGRHGQPGLLTGY